jgi:hypothetical protein
MRNMGKGGGTVDVDKAEEADYGEDVAAGQLSKIFAGLSVAEGSEEKGLLFVLVVP